MLLHSVQAFHARRDVAMVVCVLPKAFVGDPPPWLFQCDIDRLLLSVGGRERTESVANGLEDLPDEVKVVLIHDAARPFVSNAADRSGHRGSPVWPRRDRGAASGRYAQGSGRRWTRGAHRRASNVCGEHRHRRGFRAI